VCVINVCNAEDVLVNQPLSGSVGTWPASGSANPVLEDRDQLVAVAAERLMVAEKTGVACSPIRELIGVVDIALAYDVQQLVLRAKLKAGASVVGRKIGLTSLEVQRQVGVGQPDFGVLLDDMLCSESELAPIQRLLQPRVEAEIAFILGKDLTEEVGDPRLLRSAVEFVVPAIEIVDSRVRDWDIQITDTIADNASSGLFVLGAMRVRMVDIEPIEVTMRLSKDGRLASSGSGADCLGDPLTALAWLARTCLDYGLPLRAGDIVLSGALGPLVSVESGAHIAADLSGLGSVSVVFSRPESI
jgi:2-keto-4-pentenoate hydratase